MTLYVAPRAPNPRRAAMFIAEKGINGVEQVPVELRADEHKTEELLSGSSLSNLPVLELNGGRALSESRAICTYLKGRFPERNLMGATFEEHEGPR